MMTTSHDIVIKSVTEFYRKEEINAAKMMLFAECDTTIRKKNYNIDAARLDCQDIINVFNEAGLNCPTFVCKNVVKLPIATTDAFNLAKISKDISDVLRIEESVMSSYATMTCLQTDFQSVLNQCKKIDVLAEQIACVKTMIEKRNVRRIIESDNTDSDSISDSEIDDESLFEDTTRDPSLTTEAVDVDSPNPARDVEEAGIDANPPLLTAIENPGYDTDYDTPHHIETMNSGTNTKSRKPKVKAADVLRLRDGPVPKDSWLVRDGFTKVGNMGKPIRETYSETLKKHKMVFTNSSRSNTKNNVQLKPVKPKLHHNNNNGYTRRNEQCVIFISRLDPSTSTRFVTKFLKSKYHRNFRVEQLKTKYESYASFKVFAPISMKEQLVDRYNWDDNGHIYVREFIPRKTLN